MSRNLLVAERTNPNFWMVTDFPWETTVCVICPYCGSKNHHGIPNNSKGDEKRECNSCGKTYLLR